MPTSFTPEQEEIIKAVKGYSVVLAGPGSGKTFTIIEKILYIFNQKIIIDPFGVLAITFTNAAAHEMRFRLQEKGFRIWDRVFIGTYHAFGSYLLSCYGSDIGIREDFEVADSEKQVNIIGEVLKDYPHLSAANVKTAIERLKREGIYPGRNDDRLNHELRDIYGKYQNTLRDQNLLDYGDQIGLALLLLEESTLVSRLFLGHFRYLFVDEFQDSDSQQMRLVEILAKSADGVTIVADDDQSIFGWRGANRRNVEIIAKNLSAKIYQLGVNFRSDQVIVEAANKVIQQEPDRLQKNIRAASHDRGKIYIKEFQNEQEESEAITLRINQLLKSRNISELGEVAIIARARWRTKTSVRVFDANDVTWFDRSTISFSDGWDALIGLGILKLALDLDSSDELFNVMSSIEVSGLAYQFSIQDALDLAINIRSELKSNLIGKICAKNVKEILSAAKYWELIQSASWSKTEVNKHLTNIELMIGDITNLANQGKHELKDIINQLAGIGAVQILSGQESKGREFNHVFFLGLEEGVIPDRRATQAEQIAEERRIFYVGLTRTKRIAYLTSVSRRETPWGDTQAVKPSRFLNSIPPELFSEFPNSIEN